MELIVIIGAVALLVAVLLPAMVSPDARRRAALINCINNLKQIDLAFRIWANDHTNNYPMEWAKNGGAYRIFQVMSNEINTPKVLYCPADSKRIRATNFFNLNNDNISYFVGVDATENNPQAILLGDDNLIINGKPVRPGILNLTSNDVVEWSSERHHRAGNIALSDGSIQQTTRDGLRTATANGLMATNRWIIP